MNKRSLNEPAVYARSNTEKFSIMIGEENNHLKNAMYSLTACSLIHVRMKLNGN